MIRRVATFAVLGLLFAGGCSSLKANAVRDADLSKGRTFYVQKVPKDTHGLEVILRDELLRWGRKATHGPEGKMPAGTDVLVTYVNHYWWDMRMYLMQLDVEFRDPKTKKVVASAVNKRTSLVSRSAAYMAWEALVAVFKKTNPDEKPPPDPRAKGKEG